MSSPQWKKAAILSKATKKVFKKMHPLIAFKSDFPVIAWWVHDAEYTVPFPHEKGLIKTVSSYI